MILKEIGFVHGELIPFLVTKVSVSCVCQQCLLPSRKTATIPCATGSQHVGVIIVQVGRKCEEVEGTVELLGLLTQQIEKDCELSCIQYSRYQSKAITF